MNPVDPTRTADLPPAPGPTVSENPATAETPVDGVSQLGNVPVIPGYTIEDVIGRGGMGIVYRARHLVLDRIVAIKVANRGNPGDTRHLLRFLAEAQAVAAVRHPNVVEVYDSGERDGQPYLAMECLNGGTLAERMTQFKTDPREAAALMARIASGVAAAHLLGIVHRDLKPQNVLFDQQDTPKVADFGLAKRATGSDLTRTDALLGTPAYMAPEQAAGGAKYVGPSADVYALGTMLYEMLTGQPPFQAADPWALLLRVQTEEPRSPRSLNPAIPRDLERICRKCLEKSPLERYPTANELADDLNRFLAGQPVSVRPSGVIENAARWARRKPSLAAAYSLTVLSLIFASAAALAGWSWQQADRAHQEAVFAREQSEIARLAADEARDRERAAREEMAHFHYARTMNLASQYLATRQIMKAGQLLDETQPTERGWEWNYLHKLARPETLAIPAHQPSANGAVYINDGQELLSCGQDGKVAIWNASLGAKVQEFMGSPLGLYAVVYDARRKRILAAGEDGAVYIWDRTTGKLLQTLSAGPGKTTALGLSPDGETILAGRDNGEIKAWSALGQPGLTLRGPKSVISCIASSPDGKQVLASSFDGTVHFWKAADWGILDAFTPHGGTAVISVGFDPAGRIVTGAATGEVRFWEPRWLRLREPVLQAPAGGAYGGVAISPDGRFAIRGGANGEVYFWDVATGQLLRSIPAHNGRVGTVAFHPKGTRFVSAGEDGLVRVWERAASPGSFPLGQSPPAALGFSPDGEVLVMGTPFGELDGYEVGRLGDSGSPVIIRRLLMPTAPKPSVIMPAAPEGGEGKKNSLRLIPWLHTPEVWGTALALGQQPPPTPLTPNVPCMLSRGIRSLVVGPRAEWVVTASSETGLMVHSWNKGSESRRLEWPDGAEKVNPQEAPTPTRTEKIHFELPNPPPPPLKKSEPTSPVPPSVQPPPAPSTTALPPSTGSLPTGTISLLLKPINRDEATSLAASSDRKLLLTGRGDGTIVLWDTATWKPREQQRIHAGPVAGLAISPDGRWAVSVGFDRYARILELPSLKVQHVLKGPSAELLSVAISPDGQQIVTGSADFTARLWRYGQQTSIHTLRGHIGPVTAVAFTPDSQRVLSGGFDGTVRVWGTGTGVEILKFYEAPALGIPAVIRSLAVRQDGALAITNEIVGCRFYLEDMPGEWLFPDEPIPPPRTVDMAPQ